MPKDYIREIRKKIGHDPLLSVGAGVLLIDPVKKSILLEKRADNGLFCLPGGGMDLGERVEDTLRREILEETGIALGEIRLVCVFSGEKEKLLYPNGDLTYYTDFYFVSYVKEEETVLASSDGESTSLAFYPFDQLPPREQMLRSTLEPIAIYLSGKYPVMD